MDAKTQHLPEEVLPVDEVITSFENEVLKLFEEEQHSYNFNPILTVEQVDPKGKFVSYNFRTLLRISIQINGRLVLFKPIHVGLITARKNPTISFVHDADLPTGATLKWERFGAKCYKKSCKGRYLVVLEVNDNGEIRHLGLIVHVGRANQKGSCSTKDLPYSRYSWFEIRNVASFIDETNPQLMYMWDETILSQNQKVFYCEVKKEIEDLPQLKRKATESEETDQKRKKIEG